MVVMWWAPWREGMGGWDGVRGFWGGRGVEAIEVGGLGRGWQLE